MRGSPVRRLFLLVAAVVRVDTAFYAAITPLLPHYADELDLSKTAAGVLSASYAAGTLVGGPAGDRTRSRRRSRRPPAGKRLQADPAGRVAVALPAAWRS